MTIGARIREIRVDKGLSQRQLAGDQITRNMLSQIENEQAQPSLSPLQYLAAQLDVPVGQLLGEMALPQELEQALSLLSSGNYAAVSQIPPQTGPLEPLWQLLCAHCALAAARQAQQEGKDIYARSLLTRAVEGFTACTIPAAAGLGEALLRRAQLDDTSRAADCAAAKVALADLAASASVLALDALEGEDPETALEILALCPENQDTDLLRGRALLALGRPSEAITPLTAAGKPGLPLLEECYRQLGDFENAYRCLRLQFSP